MDLGYTNQGYAELVGFEVKKLSGKFIAYILVFHYTTILYNLENL